MSTEEKKLLTDAEKARIERNRIKAMHLRQAKIVSHPYKKDEAVVSDKTIKIQGTKFIDSGGGFLLEESVVKDNEKSKTDLENLQASQASTSDEAQPIPISYEECLDCGDRFADSYLFNNFEYQVCDKCRDPDDKHSLITRTEAKQQYLLKDCDLDKREPILKFITRKNPHNIRWGEMKLYLHMQVEKRALEIWGSEEELRKQFEDREERRCVTKIKRYNKQLKQLRMDVRSSLFDKTTEASHMHEFGPETYNEEEDNYTHSCLTCKYSETFEKM